jgi:hypothetical protein
MSALRIVSLGTNGRVPFNLQANKVKGLLELLESEFPGWVEL